MATRRLKDSLPGLWVEDALCRVVGDEIFFPPDDKPVSRDFYRTAKRICRRCPVRLKCLDYGLDETYGVWGGTSPAERRTLRMNAALARDNEQRVRYALPEQRTSRN